MSCPMFTPLNERSPPPTNKQNNARLRKPANSILLGSCQKRRFLTGTEEDGAIYSSCFVGKAPLKRIPHCPQKLSFSSQLARQLRHCNIPTPTFVALQLL